MLDNSLLAVNPAGPAPIMMTSDSALSFYTSLTAFALARVISTSRTSVKIFSDCSAIVASCMKNFLSESN